MTRAERKEYSSPPIAPSSNDTQFIAKSEKLVLPRPSTPPKTPRVEPPTRVSVIQRVPSQSQSSNRREDKIEIPQTQEPEQVTLSLCLCYFSFFFDLCVLCYLFVSWNLLLLRVGNVISIFST